MRKKNQKEELPGSPGCSALCGVRLRALPRDPATFCKRSIKTFGLFCDSPIKTLKLFCDSPGFFCLGG